MKYLCVGESYEKNGEKKVAWKRIGETFEGKNGKQYVKLYHMPGVLINVYDDEKAKQAKSSSGELQPDNEVPW